MRRGIQAFCLLALIMFAGIFISKENNANAASPMFDTVPPQVRVMSANGGIQYGAYVRESWITLEAHDDNSGVYCLYIKLPNTGYFGRYTTSYYTTYLEGYYEFYAEDMRGNRSSLFVVTMDRKLSSDHGME